MGHYVITQDNLARPHVSYIFNNEPYLTSFDCVLVRTVHKLSNTGPIQLLHSPIQHRICVQLECCWIYLCKLWAVSIVIHLQWAVSTVTFSEQYLQQPSVSSIYSNTPQWAVSTVTYLQWAVSIVIHLQWAVSTVTHLQWAVSTVTHHQWAVSTVTYLQREVSTVSTMHGWWSWILTSFKRPDRQFPFH
jgi:hypothetical protein